MRFIPSLTDGFTGTGLIVSVLAVALPSRVSSDSVEALTAPEALLAY